MTNGTTTLNVKGKNLSHAITYARAWVGVFPLYEILPDSSCACGGSEACRGGQNAGKHPRTPHGHKDATVRDLKQIRRWWKQCPNANIGGVPPVGVAIIDVDPRAGGDKSLAAFEAEYGPLPRKLVAKTGGDGLHVWTRCDPDRPINHAPTEGIQIKTSSGYVVLPPSNHKSGGVYEWITPFDLTDLPPTPEWAYRGVADEADDFRTFTHNMEKIYASFEELKADVAELKPIEDHDGWLNVQFAISFETGGSKEGLALALEWSATTEYWKAKPDVAEKEVRTRWRSYGRDKNKRMIRGSLIKRLLREQRDKDNMFFGKHAVIILTGQTRIMTVTDDDLTFSSVKDFHDRYSDRWEKIGDPPKSRLQSKVWMDRLGRKIYEGGVTFYPGENTDPDAYNLWRGWAVEPDPAGSCERFLEHVKKVVCNGNEEHFEWLIRWCAHMVQQPHVKPGTAVVLRGDKGAGKDCVFEYLGRLAGKHHVPVLHEGQLFGRFNLHMETALLLHIQETVWGGDPNYDSRLKALITSPTLQIERKFVDLKRMPSFMRLGITSNSDWVIPASKRERRYLVLNVSDAKCGDEHKAYFEAFHAEMEGSGPAALLHYLKGIDLTGFNVRMSGVSAYETDLAA